MAFITTLLALALAALSIYALIHPAQSIPKLQRYESKAEKAAKWSNVADNKLRRTRFTVGAALVMTLVSALSSLQYLLYGAPGFSVYAVAWAGAMCVAEVRVSEYVRQFWAKEAKVPMMDDYNDAISAMMATTQLSQGLAAGWGAMAVLKLFGY
ncbi:hypothetical protein QBC39DRAFT_358270 [Podospora conica]|nr:hypothetical protein QBC39DRAFT_358270 [Schizothecium conicum]